MNKINVAALGGLNENGKNLYIVEINDKILVFDCGIKYASDKLYGVDYIIPDFKYLVQNKNRILGVFISHPHSENMGSLTNLASAIPSLHIYMSDFCYKIFSFYCKEENIECKNVHVIDSHKKLDFKEFTVFPFNVTHSCPGCLGYSINTPNGSIIYMADYIIDPTMQKSYDMDLGRLAYMGKLGVLCLMNESVFAGKSGHTAPNHKLEGFFKTVIERNPKRIIFSVISLHISTMSEIFNAIKGKNRKVVLMGRELNYIINTCIEGSYIDIPKDMIGDLTNLKDDNTIIIVSNDREKPYGNLLRMVGGFDKFVKVEKDDTVCFADPSYDAYENIIVKLMNDISYKGANIEVIPKKKSVRYHASSEDIMLLIKLFNPKYYMPIKGEYRYMVDNATLAGNVGIKSENIILKENGSIVSFEDGQLVDNFDTLPVNDIFIDGKSSEDVGELVLKDRELLSNNGIIVISATLNKRNKDIISGPEVMIKGFVLPRENNDVINEIKKKSVEIIKLGIKNRYADYTFIRNTIREQLGEYLFNLTLVKPVILIVIQEA